MAEFTEVMRQAKRMCNELDDCDECPLRETFDVVGCPFAYDSVDMSTIEKPVMDWAAQNPEPRYPTWHEAWKQLFPNGQGSPCPAAYGMQYEWEQCGLSCNECKNRPIPADIAEKLGVKPIGGRDDD